MKIYVVNCGEYDTCGVELVTEKLELAVKLISERINLDSCFDSFSHLECWENGEQLYRWYGKNVTTESEILEIITNTELALDA